MSDGIFFDGGPEYPHSNTLPDKCPRCGHVTRLGYGLAGGGFGSYVYCENESCDFFAKYYEPPDGEGEP